jgi:ABC-2 type transport system ATP-binding protein
MIDTAVEFSGVTKRYKYFTLDQVDLKLPTGYIMGFVGANGAGKSTTLRILMGLVHQDAGCVQVLGHTMPEDQAAAKREIGFVSEDMRLYGAATLEWHMRFVRSIYPRWDHAYANDLLRRFDLHAQQKIKGMSHGQRVLDEPTAGLDPIARREVLGELMAVLADEERTVLFSSHNTLEVEQISDQITFIDRGRILESSNKEAFLDRWRRVRLVLPPNTKLPGLPGIVKVDGSSRLPVITTNRFEPAMMAACADVGVSVQAVDGMTLEEIFIASVQSQREGEAL